MSQNGPKMLVPNRSHESNTTQGVADDGGVAMMRADPEAFGPGVPTISHAHRIIQSLRSLRPAIY